MSERYHFIGIGGIGMSGLAHILLGKGVAVSGSDIAVNYVTEGLIKAGATIANGQSAANISDLMTVVYSSDIKSTNPEYQEAVRRKCKMLHRSELLAHLVEGHKSLAVAGTHGKTTTSALLSTVLVEAGLEPSFAVGGVLPQFNTNARAGNGELFAFEADESDRTFLNYHPFGAIVTNIDNDHLNAYEGSEEVLRKSFDTFMNQVKSAKHLFWCGDDSALNALQHPGQRYGFEEHCDWRVMNFRQEGFHSLFDIASAGHVYKDVELALIGRHNALNATAVFGLSISLGVPEEAIRRAFKAFKGVKRRCERKGEAANVVFIDDYAHHPTEIEATLKALRNAVKRQRLVVVFQPHRYSRTQDCLGQYGSVFEGADELIVTEIYSAGETPIPGLSHEVILSEVQESSRVPCQHISRSTLAEKLSCIVRSNDVVVTLGAGDITKVAAETLLILEKIAGNPYNES